MAMGWRRSPRSWRSTRADAIPKAGLAKKRAALEKACGRKVFVISGVTGEGIDDVLRTVAKEIVKRRGPKKPAAKAPKQAWSP